MQRILVLMATYNGMKFVKEQIYSILNQKGLAVDILISDDCSSDDTVAIIEKLMLENRSVRLIKQTRGSGSAGKNFMALIKSVEKENNYDGFAFADQDDIWLPEKLHSAMEVLNNNFDLYASNLILWDEKNNKKTLIKKDFQQKRYDFLFEGGSAGCTYVFSNSFMKQIQPVVEDLNYELWWNFSHDWFVYFFARINQFPVYIDSKPHILYRIHEENVHGHLNTLSFNSIKERMGMINKGWYPSQIAGFLPMMKEGTPEYTIYSNYCKGLFWRISTLIKYNFSLMRSPKKFIQFFILSLLPLNK